MQPHSPLELKAAGASAALVRQYSFHDQMKTGLIHWPGGHRLPSLVEGACLSCPPEGMVAVLESTLR
jgi:hypothetical protein